MSKRLSDVSDASSLSVTDRFPIVDSQDRVRLAEVGDIPSPTTVAADIAAAKNQAQAHSVNRRNHTGQDEFLTVTKAADYTVEAIYLLNPTIITVTSAATITIPPESSVPNVPVGALLYVLQTTSGTATLAGGSGVTLLSATTLTGAGANSLLLIRKVGTNTWHVGYGVAGTPTGTAPTPVNKPVFTVPPVITYDTAAVGGVSTCSAGTTDVTSTKTYAWGFVDTVTTPGVTYEGFVSPADTDTTYTHLLADVGSQMWCEVTATTSGGSTTVRAIGPTVTGSSVPAPPPPATGTGTRGVTISSFTTSGNITASSGATYYGLDFTSSGINATIPNTVSDVIFEECKFSGELLCQGVRVTFRHCNFNDYARSLLNDRGTFITAELCWFKGASTGTEFEGHAITNNYSNGPFVIDRCHFTGTYNTDCISNFQSSRVTMTNNTGTVAITLPTGAAFTMGDGDTVSRGRDNYIAFNQIAQTGGTVAPGVFGSDGNTIIEYNCFPQGIQAYNYNNGNFAGVIIRHNLINFAASYVPMATSFYGGAEYGTNINGTDCNLTPTP